MTISVIIPVYNAERFLEKAVDSALQFSEVKEVLLIEDKSTDNSLEVCKKLVAKDPRVKLFQHPDKGNHGAGVTRNLGLEKANQDFIAFLDADDYYLPNRFDVEKEIFKDEKIEGIFGALGTAFLSEKGQKEFQDKFKDSTLTTVKYPAEGKNIFLGLTGVKEDFGLFFHLNTLTFRRRILANENIKFNETLKIHQDMDFIIKLAHYAYLKTGNISSAVAIRGVHDDNRITKVKQYSTQFYQNIYKLYTSLYFWSTNQKGISPSAKKLIKLRYISFKTANKKGLSKYIFFGWNAIFNPMLLKTRFRFHALNKHYGG